MPQSRNHRQSRMQFRVSLTTIFMTTLFLSLALYGFYLQFRDESEIEDDQSRCLSELKNVKYQLDTVLKYKKTMDTVINEIQRDCFIHKQSLKDFTNHYRLVKTHLEICEVQTDELEVECKQLKAKLQKINTELEACKKTPG